MIYAKSNDPGQDKTKKSNKTALTEQAISAAGETRPAPGAPVNDVACPGCGMPRNEWAGNAGEGEKKEGRVYCCEGCAEGTGCDCI